METLSDRILRHEGLKLKPYHDTLGKLTIGAGRNLTDCGISRAEAIQMLIADIRNADTECRLAFPWFLTSPRQIQEVLTEMCFQMGIDGLKQFVCTLGALTRGDYRAAAEYMRQSLWHEQTPARAEELAALVESTPRT